MMCLPCKTAGEALDAFRRLAGSEPLDDKIKWEARCTIQDMHEECTNPKTCTCLHRALSKDEQYKRESIAVMGPVKVKS
jgi:hypothetical protein